jgi:hypothetical protein
VKVIAKLDLIYSIYGNGPHAECKLITKGKCYEAMSIRYQKDGVWIEEKIRHIPSNNQFFVKIKEDDTGKTLDVWNSYFLPTNEYRALIIDGLLKP